MRKRKKGKILSRPKSQREAVLKSLANSLFLQEKIKTTETKAKQLRPFAEKLVTKAKNSRLSDRRIILKSLTQETTKKLIQEIAPRYLGRNGGYTRIMKLGLRKSDGAKMAIIELVK